MPQGSTAIQRLQVAACLASSASAEGGPVETAAHIATIMAAVVAIAAIAFGYYQFHKTQCLSVDTLKLQRQMYADELFAKFAEQLPSCTGAPPASRDHPDFWKHSALLATTESVFRLTRGDSNWEATVTRMLKPQQAFLEQSGIDVGTFNSEFVTHIRTVIPDLKAAS